VAGPGTGKTAVLAARIAHLVERGLDPFSILALTFTNKAAGELRSRIAASIGRDQVSAITASTFHSFCLSILREHGSQAGLPADFRVLDEDERATFLGLAAAGASRPAARGLRRLGEYIETRKRFLLLPGDRELRLGPFAPAGLAALAAEFGLLPPEEEAEDVYAKYREALHQARALDFDDLVAVTARLLSTRGPAHDSFVVRYRALFVDEYQDINFAQYALMRILAPAELCVIGDPNQAIYGFRGSDRRFMDRFLVDYPDAAVYHLTKSFRCAPAIIGAAGRLVDAELEGSGGSVALSRAEYPTDKSEAEGIAREIDRLIGGTRFFALDSGMVSDRPRESAAGSEESDIPQLSSLGECAVLVRASALAPPLVKALLDHGIPYLLIGEKPWWEEEPALSVLKILRAGAEPGPPSGVGSWPPAKAIRAAVEALVGAGGSRDGAAGSRTESRAATAEAVERLAALAADFPDLRSFLDALVLGAPQDGLGRGPEVDTERVSVMTIHAAKGLEFDHVFVAGLEDGILPFTLFDGQEKNDGETADDDGAKARGLETKDDRIEEERRLLYVAMTRARVGLHLSWARSRLFRGRHLAFPPSRFLSHIEDLVPMVEAAPRRPIDKQLGLF
jgi:superfamily I DNA/RNA helicase